MEPDLTPLYVLHTDYKKDIEQIERTLMSQLAINTSFLQSMDSILFRLKRIEDLVDDLVKDMYPEPSEIDDTPTGLLGLGKNKKPRFDF